MSLHSSWQTKLQAKKLVAVLLGLALGLTSGTAAVSRRKPVKRKTPGTIAPVIATTTRGKRVSTNASKTKIPRGPWRVPTYADAVTEGDRIDGDDATVRRAAVEALGRMNGTVVVADPETGRVLTIVNQKLALRDGFQPCSTVKVPVALAALSESVVERTTMVRIYGSTTVNMTTALAKSNNQYFASLGQKLGFERVSYYARLFGLGEKAGLGIDGEQAGLLPEAPPKNGMGMMTSFGDGIALTPLELTALVGAVANGGTLYYLQYPKTQDQAQSLLPRIKRRLDIAPLIPEITPGMAGAVEYGTARRIGVGNSDPIYGKTGTCTDERSPTHLGWFGSFTETPKGKLVVTVLLTGGRGVSGPTAAGVAGAVYKNLNEAEYFAQTRTQSPVALLPSANVRAVR